MHWASMTAHQRCNLCQHRDVAHHVVLEGWRCTRPGWQSCRHLSCAVEKPQSPASLHGLLTIRRWVPTTVLTTSLLLWLHFPSTYAATCSLAAPRLHFRLPVTFPPLPMHGQVVHLDAYGSRESFQPEALQMYLNGVLPNDVKVMTIMAYKVQHLSVRWCASKRMPCEQAMSACMPAHMLHGHAPRGPHTLQFSVIC